MAETRDIFEALFIGDDVDQGTIAASMRAASDDRELRGVFNALAAADGELGGDFEARAGEAMFLEALDNMLAEEQSPNVVSLAERRQSPRAVWAIAAAALLAVSASLVMFDQPAEPEFQARSAVTETPSKYELPKLEIFCVERTDGDVRFVGSESADLATVTCPIGQEVKFALTNPDARLRYVGVVGVQDSGDLRWYGPSPAAPEAIPAPSGSEIAPIGETIRLEVNHDPGTVRVVGIFSETPMQWPELKTWVDKHEAQLRDGALPVKDGVAVRLTFEVSP